MKEDTSRSMNSSQAQRRIRVLMLSRFPDRSSGRFRFYQYLPHVGGAHLEIVDAHVFEDIMQLVDWIREDQPSPVTAEQGRHTVDIFESAYRSAETGQAQTLTTVF